METTYAIIGADSQQYGPTTLAEIKAWIGEGRVGPETKVWRSDMNSWLPAAQYLELGLTLPPKTPVPPPIAPASGATGNFLLERQAQSGARWFYWIAGLSLVNTLMALSGQRVVFVVGLAVTQYIFWFSEGLGQAGPAAGFVLCALVAGLFAMFGFFAWKRQSWSFIVGMVLYGLDALLLLLNAPGLWLAIAFHAFVLFRLFRGWQAVNRLEARA